MENITKIWQEFCEDQDSKELECNKILKKRLDEWLKNHPPRKRSFFSSFGFDDLYLERQRLHYELIDNLSKFEAGVVDRTIENALNWYCSKIKK